jgi:hypothetical protein
MPGSAPRPLDEDGVDGAEEGKYPLCSLGHVEVTMEAPTEVTMEAPTEVTMEAPIWMNWVKNSRWCLYTLPRKVLVSYHNICAYLLPQAPLLSLTAD